MSAAGKGSIPAVEDAELERELRDYYVSTSAERLATLDAAIAEARSAPGDAAAVGRLREVVHKLAGSAGTYGFLALSEAAKDLEDRIAAALAALPAGAGLLEDVQRLRDALDGEMRRAKAARSTQ